MNDLFMEVLIRIPPRTRDSLIKAGLLLLTIGSVVSVLLVGVIALIPAAVFALISYFLIPRLHLEYEYTFLNDDVQISAIYDKSSRKTLLEFRLSELQLLTQDPAGAPPVRTLDYSSRRPDATVWTAVLSHENQPLCVKLELEKEQLTQLRPFLSCPIRVG